MWNLFRKSKKKKHKTPEDMSGDEKKQWYISLSNQAFRNSLSLQSRLPTLNGISKNIKGDTAGETRKLRAFYREQIEKVENRIEEEKFYVDHYKNLAKS